MTDINMTKVGNTFLSAADILNSADLDYKEVPVPEWGGTVRLRALSAADAITFVGALEGEGKKSANARLVSMSIVNEEGVRIFTDSQISALEGKNVRVINRLANEALILNGMATDKDSAKKLVEETKND